MTERNLPGFRSFPPLKEDPKGAAVTKKDFDDSQARHEKEMNTLHLLLTGMIVVLFIALLATVFALGSMFLDNWRFHSEAYKNYVETIHFQGLLIEQSNEDRNDLLKQLDDIEAKVDIISLDKTDEKNN